MKAWVKLYTETNRDPKIGTLTWAQRGIWAALLALCGEIDDRDQGEKETGRLDTLPNVAWRIRCDVETLGLAVEEFSRRGMVAMDPDGELFLPNYPRRQARPASARPSAVAERVRRYREQMKREGNEDETSDGAECNEGVTTLQENVTRVKRGVTPSDPDPDPEKNRGEDGGGQGAKAPRADKPKSNSPDRTQVRAPPAVEVVRSVTNLYPPKALWDDLAGVVGDDAGRLALWRRVCKGWVASGWNKRNVKGMIQYFLRGEIPGDKRPAQKGSGGDPRLEPRASSAERRAYYVGEGVES